MQSPERMELVDLDHPSLYAESSKMTLHYGNYVQVAAVPIDSSTSPSSGTLCCPPSWPPPPPSMAHTDSPVTIKHEDRSSTTSPYEESICVVCGYEIRDRFILKIMTDSYHENCLRCVSCQQLLANNPTCFTKDGHVYCREDHSALFGRRCARCHQALEPTDLVFPCLNSTYHSRCFTCIYCNVPFVKGDECLVVEGEIVCRNDYHLLQAHMHNMLPGGMYDYDQSDPSRKTPKRPRTILNAQQRRQFKAAFEKSAKPCRKVREQLAKETGLSVRVVQVWFQNQRAKMKKIQRKEDNKRTSTNGSDSAKSTEDTKSSDDEVDSEGEDLDREETPAPSTKTVLTELELSNPIDKLYHMQATYFRPFS